MLTNKAIKNTAKKQLSNNWSKAYAAMAFALMISLCILLAERLITSLLSDYGIIDDSGVGNSVSSGIGGVSQLLQNYLFSGNFIIAHVISLFFIVIRFLIVTPFNQGHLKWYYSLAKGTKPFLSKMFTYYNSNNSYIYILIFRVGLIIRRVLYGIVSFIAAAAALSLSIYQFSIYSLSELNSDRQKAFLYLAVALFLVLLGAVLYALLMLKYFLASYLFADIKQFDGGFRQINSCFTRSKELMKGESARVISLIASFIPAILLCVFIVPILYVYPYIRGSLAVLANDIISTNNEKDN